VFTVLRLDNLCEKIVENSPNLLRCINQLTATSLRISQLSRFSLGISGNFRFSHLGHLLVHLNQHVTRTSPEMKIRRKTNPGSGLIIYANHHHTMNNGKSHNCWFSFVRAPKSQHLETICGSRDLEVFSRHGSKRNLRRQRPKSGGIKCRGQ
jgi:hypothetical protein